MSKNFVSSPVDLLIERIVLFFRLLGLGARPVPGARKPVPGARKPVPGARKPVPGARKPVIDPSALRVRILGYLERAGKSVRKTDILHHISKLAGLDAINNALMILAKQGQIARVTVSRGRGRPAEMWSLVGKRMTRQEDVIRTKATKIIKPMKGDITKRNMRAMGAKAKVVKVASATRANLAKVEASKVASAVRAKLAKQVKADIVKRSTRAMGAKVEASKVASVVRAKLAKQVKADIVKRSTRAMGAKVEALKIARAAGVKPVKKVVEPVKKGVKSKVTKSVKLVKELDTTRSPAVKAMTVPELAAKIWSFMRGQKKPMNRQVISGHLGHKVPASKINAALAFLRRRGEAVSRLVTNGSGRPAVLWTSKR